MLLRFKNEENYNWIDCCFLFYRYLFLCNWSKSISTGKGTCNRYFHEIQISQKPLEDILNQDMTQESVDEVWLRISELCDYGYDLNQLNEYQKNFWLISYFIGETGNGGIEQFFYNGSEFIEPTLDTLHILHLNDSYQYLKEAQSIYPREVVEMDSDSKLSEQLNKIDECYYNHAEDECYHFLVQYLQEYKDEFIKE